MNVKAASISLATAVTSAVLLLAAGGPEAAAQPPTAPVNCAVDRLGTVQQTTAADCHGRIVSDEEAEDFREQRRTYIQRVLSRKTEIPIAGKRLTGIGSGFFVAADGSVVTNGHVVENCSTVTVTPAFGEMKLARDIVRDPDADIALLRTHAAAPGVAPLVPDQVRAVVGPAYVVGYPEMGMATIEPILTTVDVLYRQGNTPYGPAIVVSGDVRRGNSGGPLLDEGGDVIGLVVAKIDSVAHYKVTGRVVREIGLVLPGDVLSRFLLSQNVKIEAGRQEAPQPNDRILEQARGYIARIGCWN
ncbi:MAG: serine protease [Kiloniellaceae bacterium]